MKKLLIKITKDFLESHKDERIEYTREVLNRMFISDHDIEIILTMIPLTEITIDKGRMTYG